MAAPSLTELEARVVEPPSDPIARVDALNALAWALKTKDPARANRLAAEARELSRAEGYALGQARAARVMAMSVSDLDGLSRVFDLAHEARRLFDEAGDPLGRAGSRDFLASLYEHVGDLAGALPLALEALTIAREIGDPVRQGYALSNVGGILAASGEPDAAVAHLEEALALFEAEQDASGIGAICSRLARAHRAAGRDDDAWRYAERSIDIAAATGDEFLGATGLAVTGEIEEARGHLAEAERRCREALACFQSEVAQRVAGAEIRVVLGRVLLARGALEAAEAELTAALDDVAGNDVFVVGEAAAQAVLADLRERQGDPAAALSHLRRARDLEARISQRDKRNKVAQVEARAAMEAAQKDAEIHKLRYVELHNVQAQLLEAEKMALLGKLAAGTAHELNTPLGVLTSNLALLERGAERLRALAPPSAEREASRVAEALAATRATSRAALERLGAIAESFRRFTQLDQAERRPFDVVEGLASALDLLEPTLPEGIRLVRRLDAVPSLDGWPRELNHAFMTVLQNAVQAIEGPGEVIAETAVVGGQIEVRIRDSGRGMSEAQAAHLFDVAWVDGGPRAKMRLGLTAALVTAQRHRGTIRVTSRLGRGTTLTFLLPIASQT